MRVTDDGGHELEESDFSTITEADLAMMRLAAALPPDDFDYSDLWGDAE